MIKAWLLKLLGGIDERRLYGNARTIHRTTWLDVETHSGVVVAVWFRCICLPFQQSLVDRTRAEQMVTSGPLECDLKAVLVEDRDSRTGR